MKQLPIASLAFTLLISTPLAAQISSDGTLSTTVTSPDALNFLIENGDRAGDNLFHSFEEFSVPRGGEAYFNNAADIVNIFSRVIGGNISHIDGILRANGTANLFLINPAGILFGENASLNLGGSFFATTAESVVFSDGLEFSANNPDAAPLLTVNIPVGLQMGSNPGDIQVNGSGHNLTFEPDGFFPPFVRETNPQGLSVQPGKTLALIGGNISIEGGQLVAEQGRIEVGSVGSGRVNLNVNPSGFSLDYAEVSDFRDIQLSQRAALDASESDISGGIHLTGREVIFTGGSVGLIQNSTSSAPTGDITVNASELLEFTGTTADGQIRSGFTSETVGFGDTGKVEVVTQNLIFQDGGQIATRTFAAGNSGDVNINASESVQVLGFAALNPLFLSSIFLNVGGGATGNAGNLTISTKELIATDGAILSAASFGAGDGGNVTVNAETIDLVGTDVDFGGSTDIRVGSFRGGDGGTLTVNTQRLTVREGARINATTIGEGNAGNVTINASEIVDVNGGTITSSATSPELRSVVVNGFDVDPTGEAGNININTDRLVVRNQGVVDVANNGPTDAGELQINARSIVLDNQGTLSATTQLGEGGNIQIQAEDVVQIRDGSFISSESFGNGNGGNITIDTDNLSVVDNSSINANAFEGSGGNIQLTTDDLLLSNNSTISADISGNGIGGSIDVVTDNLQFTSSSTISTNTTGAGSAGNINLEADTLAFDNSSILSEAIAGSSGNAGNVNLITDSLSLTNNATISTNSAGLGQAGNIAVTAQTIEANQGSITATSLQTGGGNIQLNTEDLLLFDNSLISTSVLDSTGGGGNITIDSEFIFVRENSNIQANAVFGAGGNIQINTQTIFITPDSSITASSQVGVDGIVEINNPDVETNGELIELPNQISDPTQQIATGCNNNNQSQFIATGRGGIPATPNERLSSDRTWQDLRDVSAFLATPTEAIVTTIEQPAIVVEANAWLVNAQGNLELVATTDNGKQAVVTASCSGGVE